jgi:hypothetical protein
MVNGKNCNEAFVLLGILIASYSFHITFTHSHSEDNILLSIDKITSLFFCFPHFIGKAVLNKLSIILLFDRPECKKPLLQRSPTRNMQRPLQYVQKIQAISISCY